MSDFPRYTCRKCGFATKAESELRKHRNLRECEPYVTRQEYHCCNCGKSFPTASEARDHETTRRHVIA